MASLNKSKTVKKVTQIPNASVTIEVEQKDNSESEDTAVKEETSAEETETTETAETTEATETDEAQEKNETTEKNPEDIPVNIDEGASSRFSLKKLIITVLIVVPIGFLVFGGFLYFSKNLNVNNLKNEPEKKLEIPENTPTPTEKPLDKEAYTIEVQNGSGMAGEGASVKELLDKAGFKTGAVGNADTSEYTDTIITVGSEVPVAYIEALTKKLEERGPVGKVKKFALGEDGEVLVIVGSELGLSDTTPAP